MIPALRLEWLELHIKNREVLMTDNELLLQYQAQAASCSGNHEDQHIDGHTDSHSGDFYQDDHTDEHGDFQ